MRILATCLIFTASPTLAQIDGETLANRIVEAQNVIWPDEVFSVRFDDCQLRVHQAAPNERTASRQATWVLSDFETDPSQLVINGQRMTDGTSNWIDSSVLYPLKAETRQAHAADIARYEAALDEVENVGNSGWFWRSGQTSAAVYDLFVQIADDRRTGVYGPLLQRNFGIAEGEDVIAGRYYETYGLIDTDLGFVFRDDVLDGILQDVHAYALENCPASD